MRAITEDFLRLELRNEVGEHSAGNLVIERVGIGGHHLGIEGAVRDIAVAYRLEEVVDLLKHGVVEPCFVAELLERVVERFGSGLTCAALEAGRLCIDYVHARLYRL